MSRSGRLLADMITMMMVKFIATEADIMAATVLITFGALLGVASGAQLLFIAIVETAIGCANFYLVADVFKVNLIIAT